MVGGGARWTGGPTHTTQTNGHFTSHVPHSTTSCRSGQPAEAPVELRTVRVRDLTCSVEVAWVTAPPGVEDSVIALQRVHSLQSDTTQEVTGMSPNWGTQQATRHEPQAR